MLTWIRTLTPLAWASIFAILGLIAAIWLAALMLEHHARDAAAAKVAVALDASHQASASDAIETTVRAGARDTATDATTESNRDAIYHAPGADQRLDPGLNGVGVVSLCRRAVYAGRPECVQHPGPVKP